MYILLFVISNTFHFFSHAFFQTEEFMFVVCNYFCDNIFLNLMNKVMNGLLRKEYFGMLANVELIPSGGEKRKKKLKV